MNLLVEYFTVVVMSSIQRSVFGITTFSSIFREFYIYLVEVSVCVQESESERARGWGGDGVEVRGQWVEVGSSFHVGAGDTSLIGLAGKPPSPTEPPYQTTAI